ncbi:MAG: ABC transporter ATP-binding protein [Chloroflexi bacterium]|nr:ABC transporter ATP-binding protein [Chloroflexota bacterium]MDA1228210.1 ABC transporter ATP-binding protein [Chloroflexota bacterium]
MQEDPVLKVEDLKTHFFTRSGVVKAVDGISFEVRRGETLGIVGESGSGKSMTAWSILGMVPQPAGKIVGGKIMYLGENLLEKDANEMREIRGKGICMVMQDPLTSLNPVFTVGNQILESLKMDYQEPKSSLVERAVKLLANVRIPAPESRMSVFPHQMSGGMRQRVVGAIAMSRSPNVLIADEPTTSLDATIQLQYLRLLKEIQAETGAAILFITHDFGVVARMCDRVAVMYAGKIVEQADVLELFDNPKHPYTQALLKSVPDLDEEVDFLPSIEGQPPTLDNLPVGCAFAPRCPYVFDKCNEYPTEFTAGQDHVASCWRLEGAN